MKRLIALLLCLSLLGGIFTACNKQEPSSYVPPSKEDSEENGIKLTRYTIVYPKRSSTVVREAAENLAETIRPLIEDEVKIMTDDKAMPSDEQREILIGQTNRTASKEYYAKTPSFQYHVCKKDTKILLAGYTDALTAEAVSYFIKEYVEQADDGVIRPMSDYEGQFDKTLTLTREFHVSYRRTDRHDYPYMEGTLDMLDEKLKSKADLSLERFYASSTYDPSAKEILVGRLDYAELKDTYDTMKLGGYLLSVLENKILLVASGKSSYDEAMFAFERLLAANTLYGTKSVSLPVGITDSHVSSGMLEHLPMPSALPATLLNTGYGSQVAIFEKVEQSFFADYIAKLEQAGYTRHTATNFDGSGEKKNCFATYVSAENTVDLGFHATFERMYLSVSPRGTLTLPDTAAPEYQAVDSARYPTTLTQVGTKEFHPTEHAMCYVLRIADGSFIIYDTSYGNYQGISVAEEIYEILKKQAPDPNNIVISAIILTHPHGDHMGGFVQMAERYPSNPRIKVKQIVYNFPDVGVCKDSVASNYINATNNAVKKFGAKVEIVKPRAGNVLYYADVKFNVLYTHEDYLGAQDHFDDGNTMTMVTQLVTADGCKVLFGGDQPVKDVIYDGYSFCEGALHRWYGDFLQSYVVTMFHHGLGGGADDYIYPTVKPKIVLWPGTWFRINGQSNGQPYMNNGLPYKLFEYGYNQYFSRGLTPDVWHDTPNANGVHGWFVADDGIQILTFMDGRAIVTTYDTRDLYLGRR